ncbi:hypothetical protein PZ897_05080 [Hoeflea sp. YIM 152468]|uniref:hypothetical protein n=1 Tax=Hoeflea sp. YIM 152468 TaxID=3031759 RepID=UPI0023DB0FE0|nr:hypothetical protein [Hoeflea sp. YIM 152468]MDF1607542.1 hypothetical protein [Hoeflea sp. YIM 152468]
MFEHVRSGTASKFTVAFFCALALGYLGLHIAYSKGQQDSEKSQESFNVAYEASDRAYGQCLSRSTIDEARDCYEAASFPTASEMREQKNLNAQREMAQWSYLMLIVTVLTFTVGGVGVVFVWFTFRETRATVDILRAENRSWLLFMDCHAITSQNMTKTDENDSERVVSIINNGTIFGPVFKVFGNSAIFNLSVVTQHKMLDYESAMLNKNIPLFDNNKFPFVERSGVIGPGVTVPIGQDILNDTETEALTKQTHAAILHMYLRYKNGSSKAKWCYTEVCVSIVYNGQAHRLEDGTISNITMITPVGHQNNAT